MHIPSDIFLLSIKDANVIKGCLKRTLSKNKSSNELTKKILQLVLKEMNKKLPSWSLEPPYSFIR